MRIGLLGGSFNPPHAAHRAVSLLALKRLRLDRVWWLVSPGNPLKDNKKLTPLDERIERARALAADPRIDVTAIEAALGTVFSHDTVAKLRARYPNVRFVFLMGADNLAAVPSLEALARTRMSWCRSPSWTARGLSLTALASPAALALARWRLGEPKASVLARSKPPAWIFLHGMKSPLSSTAIRAKPKRKG